MPRKSFEVKLTDAEVERLKAITHKGASHSAKTIMHANILLNTNDGSPARKKDNRAIAEIFDISPTTVNEVRKIYVTEGLDAALNRKTRITPPTLSKITGDFEARAIAIALGPFRCVFIDGAGSIAVFAGRYNKAFAWQRAFAFTTRG